MQKRQYDTSLDKNIECICGSLLQVSVFIKYNQNLTFIFALEVGTVDKGILLCKEVLTLQYE